MGFRLFIYFFEWGTSIENNKPNGTITDWHKLIELNWIYSYAQCKEYNNLRLIVLNAGVARSIDSDGHTIHHQEQLIKILCIWEKGNNSNWHLHYVHSSFHPINDFQFVRSTAWPKPRGETINWSRTNSESFNYRSHSNENNAKTNSALSSQSRIICVLCFHCAVYCFEFGRWLFSTFRSHLICWCCCSFFSLRIY